jgi:hypothetical protein
LRFGLFHPIAFFGLIRLAHSFKKNKKKNKEEFGRFLINCYQTKLMERMILWNTKLRQSYWGP